MHRNQSVSSHQFAMVPKADIPRSVFRMQRTYKTTFDAGYLIPVFCEELLPGDTWNCRATMFARLATPIFPVMDNLYLESFFFYVPSRILWTNWVKFMGEQVNPADSISYTIPKVNCGANGYSVGSVYDYFGLPTVGQVTAGQGGNLIINALPLRGYNQIYNEWFRDENLINSVPENVNDGPDGSGDYILLKRGKRHDYFTGCLPWTQKGGVSVSIPLGTSATVRTQPTELVVAAAEGIKFRLDSGAVPGAAAAFGVAAGSVNMIGGTLAGAGGARYFPTNLYADLTTATAATINQLRQSFQIQRLLERDARGGTRYVETIFAHFGVRPPDFRLQRPEYLGGGSTPIAINPVAQTSATGLTGGSAPLGNLSAFGQALHSGHAFTYSATEHGYVIGLVNVRCDLTYQQGLRRMWTRQTRYDFYYPVFAYLGEQAVLNQEIYVTGTLAQDQAVFGYQERWAEYRYLPSQITGLFRSTSAGTVDPWHLSQKFTALPTLNQTFIEEAPPLSRVLAVGAGANGQQLLFDAFFDIKAARPMPLYSVPGNVDRF